MALVPVFAVDILLQATAGFYVQIINTTVNCIIPVSCAFHHERKRRDLRVKPLTCHIRALKGADITDSSLGRLLFGTADPHIDRPFSASLSSVLKKKF